MRLRRSVARLILSVILAACAASAPRVVEAQTELIVAQTQGEKLYHRPGCPVIRDGANVLAMTRGEAESRGYKSHRDCDPAVSTSKAPPAAAGSPAAKAPPETVYIDAAATHYHRKGCAKLGDQPKPVALTAVGKRWPCPSCRPPVPKRRGEPLIPRWRG